MISLLTIVWLLTLRRVPQNSLCPTGMINSVVILSTSQSTVWIFSFLSDQTGESLVKRLLNTNFNSRLWWEIFTFYRCEDYPRRKISLRTRKSNGLPHVSTHKLELLLSKFFSNWRLLRVRGRIIDSVCHYLIVDKLNFRYRISMMSFHQDVVEFYYREFISQC